MTTTTTIHTTSSRPAMLILNTNTLNNNKMWRSQKVRLKSNSNWLLLRWCLLALLLAGTFHGVQGNNNNNNKYPNRPPRFLIDGHSEIVLRLKEGPDTPVGSLIYKLRGSDPDNDAIVFGIRDTGYGSDVLRIENIGNNEANLYLAQELDREVGFIGFEFDLGVTV